MILAASLSSPRRLVALGATVVVLAASLTGCGSSAPASAPPAASIAAATPAPAASTPAASVPTESTAPSSGASAPATGADPAAGLTIDAPYTLTALPGALQQTLETQFASGVGAFGSAVQVGFRQIGGGNATGSILMVIAFPAGSLSATAYQAALAGMGSSMGAAFTTSTVEGVDVASGTASTGGVGVFHIGDHMLVVISPSAAEALPIATALIKANN